jgi:ABC-2 type transport system ATP-binding protein
MTVLRTDHLAKTYVLGFFRKKVRAITDVSLQVEPGEIFGLLGPNGAGKTTTLKVLMGLIRPSSGTAEVLGKPVGDLAAKRRLGYLPESPYFYDYLTGRELLVFMAKLFGLSRAEARRRAGALLEQVDLTRAADLALRRYSKGMLQRVGIAQALVNDPELVILDEPLTGLDPLGRKDLRELIADLRRQGKTVLLSSHILADVEMLADRVAILVRGRTVNTGPLHELLDARILTTDVVVKTPSEELVAALQQAGHTVLRVGDSAQITLTEEQAVDPVLQLVQQHHGSIHAVTPRKESLEDLVVRQAKAGES